MKYRSITYFKRKKALQDMLNAPDLKSMLKAEFYASKNVLVKKHVLKMYKELNQMQGSQSIDKQ